MKQRSSSQPCSSTPRPVNHACRDVGHDWQITTDETIRQCTRRDCRAVERFMYDSWVAVPSSPRQPETQPLSDLYQQQSFWANHQHMERPLALESMTLLTQEQRAHFARLEREYYNLSSDRRVRRGR